MDVESVMRDADPGDRLRVVVLDEDVDETVVVDDVDFVSSPPAPGEEFSEKGELVVHLVDDEELAEALGTGSVMLELWAEKRGEDSWSTPVVAAVDVETSSYTGEEWTANLVEQV